jgi:hypothetical protein
MSNNKPDFVMDVLTGVIAFAAIVQAIAAGFVAKLTSKLTSATERYAKTTDEALALTANQFDSDWRPDLRISDIQRRGTGQIVLIAANLARPAVLVKQIKIRRIKNPSEAQTPTDTIQDPLGAFVPGEEYRELSIEAPMRNCRMTWSPLPQPPVQRSFFKTEMELALVYDSARGEGQTAWYGCYMSFADQQVVDIVIRRRECALGGASPACNSTGAAGACGDYIFF